jgi:hypothetical protein|tara:strand:- start:2454 stop:2975 length:522 start_codon:yes stop_codon:yes gene_type:complete
MGNASKERVDLIRKVYSKTEYPKIIDTSFNQLGVVSVTQQIDSTFTVEEFFQKYNELFYEIPPFGESNSHEYLITTSGDYINFDQDNELVSALQKEIAQLRTDLLQAQLEKAEAITGEKISLNTGGSIDELTAKEFANLSSEVNSNEQVNPDNATVNPTSNSTSGIANSNSQY